MEPEVLWRDPETAPENERIMLRVPMLEAQGLWAVPGEWHPLGWKIFGSDPPEAMICPKAVTGWFPIPIGFIGGNITHFPSQPPIVLRGMKAVREFLGKRGR